MLIRYFLLVAMGAFAIHSGAAPPTLVVLAGALYASTILRSSNAYVYRAYQLSSYYTINQHAPWIAPKIIREAWRICAEIVSGATQGIIRAIATTSQAALTVLRNAQATHFYNGQRQHQEGWANMPRIVLSFIGISHPNQTKGGAVGI